MLLSTLLDRLCCSFGAGDALREQFGSAAWMQT
jgi:hypothetical protein